MTNFITLFVLFVCSLCLTHLILVYSLKKNILDVPNQRSSHKIATPRGGGLAFVCLFYMATIILWLNNFINGTIFLALLGGIPVALVGYCDDVFGVKAQWRMLVHFFSAFWGLAWLMGAPLSLLFFIFSLVTTVWFINLYNFMDGIDGLAGMEAVFVSAAAGFLLLINGSSISYFCFALTFSVLGFLVLNWPPAKIFMGDVGSGFLGYIFALLMWITNNGHPLLFPVWFILLGVFIADASFTLIYRMMQKKQWWSAHREHAYQWLAQAGFSHQKITGGILCCNLFLCLPATLIYLHFSSRSEPWPYLLMLSASAWFVWLIIIKNYHYKAGMLVNDQL